jgi:hypothetical protein
MCIVALKSRLYELWGDLGEMQPRLCSARLVMKLNLTPSTGETIVVWRERDTYCARHAGDATEPEVCLAVDLFEVIAEIAGLDLDRAEEAAEAVRLAEEAQRRLRDDGSDDSIAEERRRLR